MSDPASALPLSGMGGISNWRDAVEFMLLGCGTVQVCTAAMHYGYRVVEDMTEGLENWMRIKGFATLDEFRGLSVERVTDWKNLNLNYKIVAHIDEQTCIGCGLCQVACWDGAHQCIHTDRVSGPVNGRVELHDGPPTVEFRSRNINRHHARHPPGTCGRRLKPWTLPHTAREDPARGRDRVYRLQFMCAGLSRGRMHHDGSRGRCPYGEFGSAFARFGVHG